ncbi:TPA: hypothetical protein N0F65_002593 [Lagenidium giganteum]|uniref:Uncharacterized protein n=1 Tax=Lagenidium giganteum TaxID=4803 RepID=A0AAV2YYK7_9STRA|nr:TPA: hypothetical protein N0F65_002593 [Lagenidium giganteum]
MACAALDRRGISLARGAVIMVHGMYGHSLPLKPLQWYLQARMDFDVQQFCYSPREQSLEVSGKLLSQMLKDHKPHVADDAVHFVTFDYGSLVLREAFRSVDWNYTKSKVVMLAPPNRGLKYYRSMQDVVGQAGYGGVAAQELAQWQPKELDKRLGKLPRRCFPMVVAGSLCLNPFNQANYPNDGLVMLEETMLPGEFRHFVVPSTHYLLPMHPSTISLVHSFIEA